MISLIISTYNEKYFNQFLKNVKDTIGNNVEYEIIQIWNPGLMSICEAYNKGAVQAKYDNLLFVHEDVQFYSTNWYTILEKYFQLPNLGVFGLAGNKRKFDLPYGFHSGLQNEGFMFVNHRGHPKISFKQQKFPFEVKVIDGVFIGMKKNVWKEIPFSKSLKGFHFYDLDISLRTSVKHQNYLVTDLDIEHFSIGNFGDQWIEACIEFHRDKSYNYDMILPKEKRDVRNFWYKRLLEEKISFRNRLRYSLNIGCNKDTLRSCIKFLLNGK